MWPIRGYETLQIDFLDTNYPPVLFSLGFPLSKDGELRYVAREGKIDNQINGTVSEREVARRWMHKGTLRCRHRTTAFALDLRTWRPPTGSVGVLRKIKSKIHEDSSVSEWIGGERDEYSL